MPPQDTPLEDTPPAAALAFGPYVLHPARHSLLRDGRPVRLGGRPFDLLATLASRSGEVLSVEALKRTVWPGLFIEDGNIRVQISALRKVLGVRPDGGEYIANVSGRGYSFVGEVTAGPPAAPAAAPVEDSAAGARWRAPAVGARLVGRSREIERLRERLLSQRFVSVIGPGGVGKTSLALAAAGALEPDLADGAVFVDLAPLATRDAALAALAAAVGVSAGAGLSDAVSLLARRQALVVLDNCEHLLDAAGEVAEALTAGAPGCALLTTSREPLRAEGEQVLRLEPLALPPADASASAAEALGYAAVRLFEQRARARLDGYAVSDADAPLVAEICRRVDGLPLAIELAAATVDVFGLKGLASQLTARLDVLNRGRRTALPRQQTLKATLDWSYDILAPDQRRVLQRLAIFAGPFTLEAACQVAACAQLAGGAVVEAVAELAAKSLLDVDLAGEEVRYRLLESTRVYALDRLTAAGEATGRARLHAAWCQAALEAAEPDWTPRGSRLWMERRGALLDEARAALARLAAPEDLGQAVDLLAAAMPLLYRRSLMAEALEIADGLLARLALDGFADRRRTQLAKSARAISLWHARGLSDDVRVTWREAWDLACDLGDRQQQLVAAWGLWTCGLYSGDIPATRDWARHFSALAADRGPADRADADYIMGCAVHADGDNDAARRCMERVVAYASAPQSGAATLRYGFNQLISAHTTHAKLLWLQGFADQAVAATQRAVVEAEAMDHGLTLGFALVDAAANMAMLRGEPQAARAWLSRCRDMLDRHGLPSRRPMLEPIEAQILMLEGHIEKGAALALQVFFAGNPHAARNPGLIGGVAELLAKNGWPDEAWALIERTLAGHARHPGSWVRPEALRAAATVRLARDGRTADALATAEAFLREAHALAVRTGVWSWRLKTATTMLDLWRGGPLEAEARATLEAALAHFTEGFETADYRAARAALAP